MSTGAQRAGGTPCAAAAAAASCITASHHLLSIARPLSPSRAFLQVQMKRWAFQCMRRVHARGEGDALHGQRRDWPSGRRRRRQGMCPLVRRTVHALFPMPLAVWISLQRQQRACGAGSRTGAAGELAARCRPCRLLHHHTAHHSCCWGQTPALGRSPSFTRACPTLPVGAGACRCPRVDVRPYEPGLRLLAKPCRQPWAELGFRGAARGSQAACTGQQPANQVAVRSPERPNACDQTQGARSPPCRAVAPPPSVRLDPLAHCHARHPNST